MTRFGRRRAAVTLSGLSLLGGFLVVLGAPPTASAGSFCGAEPGLTANVFEPAGSEGNWLDADNWSGDVPDMLDDSDGYVCIPSGKTAVMEAEDGVRADIQLIDVAGGLRIERGNKLFVFGDKDTRASTFRDGSDVVLTSSTLGGSGRIDVHGDLVWRSTGQGASTITSRPCTGPEPCLGEASPSERGLLVVGDEGTVAINGRGVNLDDQYTIRVAGALRLTNDGYIAADRGTNFELRGGRFRISNDGGYYEGDSLHGLTMLSTFLNRGEIIKDAGGGTAVIAATYTLGKGGSVRVDSGALDITTQEAQVIDVGAGRTYGNGGCASYDTYNCDVEITADDPDRASFTAPKNKRAKVQVFELGSSPAAAVGKAVRIHAKGLAASRKKPAVLTLGLDDSILQGRGWKKIDVFRAPNSGGAYKKVPACKGNGQPPGTSAACVDRRGLARSSRNVDGDVIMVIRTTGTSRWVARFK